MAGLVQITQPGVEPLTLAEAKLHLRVTHSEEDARITRMIVAARSRAEHELGRKLISQQWEMVMDEFPMGDVPIRLEVGIASAVVQVTYVDTAQVTQTLSASRYTLDVTGSAYPLGYLMCAYGYEWPTDVIDSANVVRVRLTCGFGSTADDVPATIKEWMLVQIGTMYRNREAFAEGVSVAALPNRWTDSLLDNYRLYL